MNIPSIQQVKLCYSCTTRQCTAYLKTNTWKTKLLEMDDSHIHAARQGAAEQQVLRASCKRKATECPMECPSKIVRSTLRAELPESEQLSNNSLRNTARAVSRIRRTTELSATRIYYPPIEPKPRDFLQLHQAFDAMTTKTCGKQEEFLLLNDIREGTVVFTCDSNLRTLCRSDCDIYADGAMTPICPKYFSYMYIVHGQVNQHYVPLVFALIVDRKEKTYNALWNCLVDRCKALDLDLQPTVINLDFDITAFRAAQTCFPNARCFGERFHFGKTLWLKIEELGLANDYTSLTRTGVWLHHFYGLPFLTPAAAALAFTENLMSIIPHDEPRARIFAEYFAETFVYTPVFTPDVWAELPMVSSRSTNLADVYRASLNKHFGFMHQRLSSFWETLLDIQARTDSKQFFPAPKYNNKQRARQRNLIRQYEKLEKDTKCAFSSTLDYIKIVGFKFAAGVD